MNRPLPLLVVTITAFGSLTGCGHFGDDSLAEFRATGASLATPQGIADGTYVTLTLERNSRDSRCGPLADSVVAYINGVELSRGNTTRPNLSLLKGRWECPGAVFYGPASLLERATAGITRVELVDGQDSAIFTVRDAAAERKLVPRSDVQHLTSGTTAAFSWSPASDRLDPQRTKNGLLRPENGSADIWVAIDVVEGTGISVHVPQSVPPGRYELQTRPTAWAAVVECSLPRCRFPVRVELEQPITVVR